LVVFGWAHLSAAGQEQLQPVNHGAAALSWAMRWAILSWSGIMQVQIFTPLCQALTARDNKNLSCCRKLAVAGCPSCRWNSSSAHTQAAMGQDFTLRANSTGGSKALSSLERANSC